MAAGEDPRYDGKLWIFRSPKSLRNAWEAPRGSGMREGWRGRVSGDGTQDGEPALPASGADRVRLSIRPVRCRCGAEGSPFRQACGPAGIWRLSGTVKSSGRRFPRRMRSGRTWASRFSPGPVAGKSRDAPPVRGQEQCIGDRAVGANSGKAGEAPVPGQGVSRIVCRTSSFPGLTRGHRAPGGEGRHRGRSCVQPSRK